MESWKTVWRNGIAPQLTDADLISLGRALAENDFRLTQGTIADPCVNGGDDSLRCARACALAYCAMVGLPGASVGYVTDRFEAIVEESLRLTGNAQATEVFLRWFDGWPRDKVFRDLLSEVACELFRRLGTP